MKLFLGCYRHDRSKWFLVWAPTRTEAINWVECDVGEPDVDSFVQLRAPGMVDFEDVQLEEDDDGHFMEFQQGTLRTEDLDANQAAAEFRADNPNQPAGMNDPHATELGVQDARVGDTYAIMNGLAPWPEDDEPCPWDEIKADMERDLDD